MPTSNSEAPCPRTINFGFYFTAVETRPTITENRICLEMRIADLLTGI